MSSFLSWRSSLDLAIDPLDLAFQLDRNIVTGQITGIVHRQAALDLLQAEPEGLELANELQAPQAFFSEQAVTAFAAADRRQQAQVFVVAQGLDRHIAAGQRSDLHAGLHANSRHGLDSPAMGRLLGWASARLSRHSVNPIALALLLSTGVALVPGAARAQVNDMFPSKAAAEQRAKELKCGGAFAMGKEWMPCQNFDVYQKAVSKEK